MNEERAFAKFVQLQQNYPPHDNELVIIVEQILRKGSDSLLKKVIRLASEKTVLKIFQEPHRLQGISCTRIFRLARYFGDYQLLDTTALTGICCYFARDDETYFYQFCDRFKDKIQFCDVSLWIHACRSVHYREHLLFLLDKTSGIVIPRLLEEIFPILYQKPYEEMKSVIADFNKFGYR